jgi:hypothetical protein
MRPLPPGYNLGRPIPGRPGIGGRPQPRPGVQPQQPFQPLQPRPGVIVNPAGPRQQQGPIGLPRQGQINTFNSTPFPRQPGVQPSGYSQYGATGFGPMQGQGVGDPRLGAATIPGNRIQMMMRGPSQTPMQQFSYGGRAGYQMGGGIMGLENDQEEPIFPRLETLNENLGQAEQTLGYPSNNQFNASSITTAITGRPQMNRGGSPEEEMENIKEFYYGRRRGDQEDLLDEYERFKMRKDFLRRYPRDEARFGGRMGYPKTGIGSLANRQGYFLGGVGDFVGDLIGGAGDVLGGIGDIGGDILGSVGDVLGDLDLGQLMQIYQIAAPFVGLPPMPGGEFASFLPGSVPGGEGGLGSLGNILGNFGSFMPQEGSNSGFNPYQFASNLIMNQTQQGDQTGGGNTPMDTVSIITNLLRKFLTPESIAGAGASTVAKLTYDEMKRLNALREEEFRKYKEGSARKRTQYRTAEGREALPGYEVKGVPQTTADVFRAPAMKGGIMNVPTGQPRRNAVGVKEIDYRQSGGFVPPIGVKEKADDIPAMLSNNEFVFTADAVRAAGGGSVNKGAQKMYSLMKQLEGKL